jgi:cytochrome c553
MKRPPAALSGALAGAVAGMLALAGLPVRAPAQTAPAGPAGASSCTGCHGEARLPDVVLPRIEGRSAADLAGAMRAYRSGAWPSSVMGRIAKGFDDRQIEALAAWFAAQRP